jgi:hypothetical protein
MKALAQKLELPVIEQLRLHMQLVLVESPIENQPTGSRLFKR